MSNKTRDGWQTLAWRVLSTPRFWLGVGVALLAAVLYCGERFELVKFPDSPTYTELIDAPLVDAMKSRRTLGYPLVLALVRQVSPDYQWLPWLQFLAFCGAVLAMDSALRRWGASPWQVLAADAGLLWSGLLNRELVGSLLTDLPGLTAAIAATAFLLMVVATPNKVWPWIAMTLCLALAYHIRPAFLFLVGFAPVTGILLRRMRAAYGAPVWPWPRFAGALTGAAVVPLLVYFSLRWAMVGEFALVSFGGYNSVGMAVELLTPETIERDVPERLQPLARKILAKRESLPSPRAYAQGISRARYPYFFQSYHDNVELSAVPTIAAYYNCPYDFFRINRVCGELLRPVLWRNKLKYAKIVMLSFTQSLDNTFQWYTGKWWLPSQFRLAVKILFFGALGILAFRLRMRQRWPLLREARSWLADGGATWAFLLATSLFVMGNMFLLCTTAIPISRYVFAAVAILSGAVVMWIAREWAWAMTIAVTAIGRGSQQLAATCQDLGSLRTRIESLEAEIAALKDGQPASAVRSKDEAFQQDLARKRSAA